MNDLETIVTALTKQGFYPVLNRHFDNWLCDLTCGVDVLPANLPRPRGTGKTAVDAVLAADAARKELAK